MWLVYQVMLGLMYEWDYFINSIRNGRVPVSFRSFFGVGFLQQSPFILLPPSFCEHSLEASALVLLLGGNHQ